MKEYKNLIGLLIIVVLILSMGIVYAAISGVGLTISGFVKSKAGDFDVRFTDSEIVSKDGIVTAQAYIDDEVPTQASLEISDLQYMSDYVIVAFTVTNNSSVLYAEISDFTITLSDQTGNENNYDDDSDFYINYWFEDGTLIPAGESTVLKIKVQAKDNFSEEITKQITISFNANPRQPAVVSQPIEPTDDSR